MNFDGQLLGHLQPSNAYSGSGPINANNAFSGRTGATELLGTLTRAQWDDWVQRFSPYIDQLSDIATDEGRPEEAAQSAMQAVDGSFANARMGLDLQESRSGVAPGADEREVRERSMALAQAGAKANAANSARIATQDQQLQILAGGAAVGQLPLAAGAPAPPQ